MRDIIHRALVWGDSLLKGVIYNESKDKFQNLEYAVADEVSEALGIAVENRSKFGSTVTRGEENLDRALARGVEGGVAVLEFGGNDCDFHWPSIAANPDGDFQPNTPLNVFAETYRRMIRKLREHAIEPILMTLPPIDSRRYFAWFSRNLNKENIMRWLCDIDNIYCHQELYSDKVAEIARIENCELIDIRSELLGIRRYKELLCADGIHLNQEGHHVLAQIFLRLVQTSKTDLHRLLTGESKRLIVPDTQTAAAVQSTLV